MATLLLSEILEQHAEDAAFLWTLRRQSLVSAKYDLNELVQLDERLEAHLDGLRIGREQSWKAAKETFKLDSNGEAFVFSHIAYHNADTDQIAEVIETVKGSGLHEGLISAVGWMPLEIAKPIFQQLIKSSDEAECAMGLGAMSLHREEPASGLTGFLNDNRVTVVRRAVRMVGELGRQDLLSIIKPYFSAEDESLIFWASWSAALLGDSVALHGLKVFVDVDAYALRALNIALRRLPVSTAAQWLEEFSQDEKSMRLVIEGAGIIGDPVFIEGLLNAMRVPALARVAGESFTMITGMALAQQGWAVSSPISEEESVLDTEAHLPWPDAAAIAQWWESHQSGFQTGVRHLVGQPITQEHAQRVLRTGTQRQRAAAALELALLIPGMPLFETRAPGLLQQKLLG